MNRFRAKKKGGKEEMAPRPSQDSESVSGFNPFRKSKKAPEAEKPDLDLSSALPSNDDFRTSLLMSGLSARFSMLREQDDPGSKIGKASDDSVLYPRRQSRLDFGNMRDLGDISEVDSIKLPPSIGRGNSFHSGNDTDSITGSSIMGRAKPTEGNNLFGGRQKIYKIPVGADSSRTIGGGGGMGGRALYDDDVASSAFQKWRQAEKGRGSPSQDDDDESTGRQSGDGYADSQRDESPYLNSWNRKRETSSTTSSIPSMARNSTAATSVASSQPAPSLKDGQFPGPHTSVSSASGLDKSVSRARRLYETGLSNDLHEHQTSALSRIDTLSRQRTLGGSRTPESRNSPSPTIAGFLERSTSDRKLLAKASAPNLRSMSPPASASATAPPEHTFRAPSAGESRVNSPLSPPVSESEDTSFMSIGPNDKGKATALGVFQRPAQAYDESRYAQRQIQLNQGRDTPILGRRPDSNASSNEARSRSCSSSRKQTPEKSMSTAMVPEEEAGSFLIGEESEDAPSPVNSARPSLGPSRPSDNEHPAFRAAIPLSVVTQPADENTENSEVPTQKGPSANDSPTLGPTSGLSGMVRQHLRGDSNASSIYGGAPPTGDLDSQFPRDTDDLATEANPYSKADPNQDWDLDFDGAESIAEPMEPTAESQTHEAEALQPQTMASPTSPNDEFASRLADGARRVRERLTSYVESDSRSTSPYPMPENPDHHEAQPPLPPPTGLGIVRPKGSFGSLAERGRDPASSKAMKMLGLGSRGQSPTGVKNEPLSSAYEHMKEAERTPAQPQDGGRDSRNGPPSADSGAGLRAFRQARRDNRRMKDQENMTRRQQVRQSPPSSSDASNHPQGHGHFAGERFDHSHRVQNPRIARDGSAQSNYQSHAQYSSDRDRSGSDSSNGGRSVNGSHRALQSPFHGSFSREASPQGRGQGMRPAMPGPDYRRSPAMPSPGYPRQSPRAAHPEDYPVRARGMESGQPSPLHTSQSPMMGSGPNTPNNAGYSPNRSGPYPPGSSPNGSRSQSRSGSRTGFHAPPVPPINPRRRPDEVQPKPMPPGVSSRVAEARNAFAANDEDERRLRKGHDLPNFNQRPSGQALPVNLGPPASRSVVTQSLSRPNSGLPGGMI